MDNIKSVVLEESIMQKGTPATAGSRILEDFVSPLDATVVGRLQDKGIKIVGRTEMDEFGIDHLFRDGPEEVAAAVKAVADGAADFALCNDLYGKKRRQAAEQKLCYIHPTYGTVSRYGLIPLAASMDQIGIVGRDLAEGFQLLSIIAGKDEKDGAMFPEESYQYEKTDKKIRIGVPAIFQEEFQTKFDSISMKLDYFDVYKQVMYILSCAEISNNISRYDGIKFGYRTSNYKSLNDLYVNTRTEAFGLDTKLAAVMGSMALSTQHYTPYYEKAMKIRRLIKESLHFDDYDVIALSMTISEDPYENLSLFALAPLAGLPSVSFSWNGSGIQLIADVKDESALLTAWEELRA